MYKEVIIRIEFTIYNIAGESNKNKLLLYVVKSDFVFIFMCFANHVIRDESFWLCFNAVECEIRFGFSNAL